MQKYPERLDWDGLRYFRAVAAEGTLSGASRRLRVEHSTVARRLHALEEALGARLFLRNPRGYTLTRVGQSLLESVETVRSQIDEIVRLANGQDVEMNGTVRIATADTLAKHVVLPALARLMSQHPGLLVELVSDTRQHDLSRREADVALRIGESVDTRLVGRKLAALGFGLYSSRPPPRKFVLRRANVVTFDENVGKIPHESWLAQHAPQARVVLRANRQETLVEAVRRGLGVSLLPCVVADQDAALKRLLGPPAVFSRDLWLLVHPQLQAARRVRAVMGAIASWVEDNAARIAGV